MIHTAGYNSPDFNQAYKISCYWPESLDECSGHKSTEQDATAIPKHL